MLRQCAWCLRLINGVGERTSLLPVPKIYEATHGICRICGIHWLETVVGSSGGAIVIQAEDGRPHIQYMGEAFLSSPPPLEENEGKTPLAV